MNTDAIYALDGTTLTRLAFELRLMPVFTHQVRTDDGEYLWTKTKENVVWEPHQNITQAEAVFRVLRTQGWATKAVSSPTQGFCEACPVQAPYTPRITVAWCLDCQRFGEQETEALALLRCAVLALTSGMESAPV